MNRKSLVAGAAFALLVAACSAGADHTKSDDGDTVSTENTSQDTVKGASDAADTVAGTVQKEALPDFAPAADSPAIRSLSWGDDGTLFVGFADGKYAKISPDTREAALESAVGAGSSVVAVSPGAKLALAATDPPVVTRLRDRQTVLRLSSVSKFETGGFLFGGEGLFIVEPDGKLHVWRQAETDLDQVATRDLKQFMARQSPDFTANLSPLSDDVLVTSKNALIMATETGKVLHWRPNKPEEIEAVVQLPAAARSFGFDGRHIAATAADGSFRAISLFENSFLPWSMEATGDIVAASPELADKFVVADQGTLSLRNFADGATKWEAKLPEGELCGLTFSPDATQLAVCVDSGVVLVEPSSGQANAALRRNGDAIEWR